MKKNSLTLILSILTVVTYFGFAILRTYQLLLPDPYKNPLTVLSTACLLAFLLLALALVFSTPFRWKTLNIGTKVLACVANLLVLIWFVTSVMALFGFFDRL
jgi:ABC-type uncharacterized transport system permease subunit